MNTVDMQVIETLIDEVPAEAFGCTVLSDDAKQSHKTLLRHRLEHGFGTL